MIIKRMLLENYGLFSGKNEFDLDPNRKRRGPKKKRPIILFGGKNGAGKTTFLGATRLLLYGRQSLEGKVSQAEYEKVLIGHLHRKKSAATCADFARIGLEFDHVINGEKNTYYVERNWTLKSGGRVQETFKVDKDGATFEDVGPKHWESFISDIVPARLSQLFFFDGEKIKSIAEDLSSNVAIAEAIQSLLGIDNVLSLKSDLKIYKSRLLKDSNPEDYQRNLTSIENAIKVLDEEEALLRENMANLKSSKDELGRDTQALELELEGKGGDFAADREANKHKAEHLKELITVNENQIRVLADTALPFALCPKVSAQLVTQLDKEQASQKSRTAEDNISALREVLLGKASQLKSGQKTAITQFIDAHIADYISAIRPTDKTSAIHQLNERDSGQLTRLLEDEAKFKLNETLAMISRLESLHLELHDINRDLVKAPAVEDISDLLKKLKEESKKLGDIESQMSRLEDEMRKLSAGRSQLERDKIRAEDKMKAEGKESEKLDYLKKLGPALDAYQKRLTLAKIETLRHEVTECFNRLARKSDFVKGIDIDPQSFSVTLLDEHGRSIPREDLSSGEKQIFAIAMLWGLARTSGRPLPVVIDTPLGRLDSDHRKKLIQNYFPNAGHQVILLSTDTEVDQNLYNQLEPHISQSYHLEYDHKKGHTKATADSYFWRAKQPA
jgi:DNA sulfur modification protein DndD